MNLQPWLRSRLELAAWIVAGATFQFWLPPLFYLLLGEWTNTLRSLLIFAILIAIAYWLILP